MAQQLESDSDDSSSPPPGPPGGGPLVFLPTQHANDVADSKYDSDSSSSSDGTPVGLPGGGGVLTFLPTNTQEQNNSDYKNNDSSSSSSSCSSPIGMPGGNQLSFLPVDNGDNDSEDDEKKANDETSSSDDDDDSVGLPGGGDQLTFLPVNPQQHCLSAANDGNMLKHKSIKYIKTDKNDYGQGMNMMEDYENDMIENTNSFNTGLETIASGVCIDDVEEHQQRLANSHHAASYSNDDIEVSPSPHEHRPKMSTSKTQTNELHTASKIHSKRKSRLRSSTLTESKKQNNAVWDLVYMTSSPLVCRKDFIKENKQKQNNKNGVGGKDEFYLLELLDVSRETDEFMSVLRAADRQICVVHEIATSGNLIKAMAHQCRILHYSGHGFPSYLAFEDENSIGETHMLKDEAFRKIVTTKGADKKTNKLQLELVFTSACHSEFVGKAFVSSGVPHVVAIDTKFEVSDEGATTFTKYFYDALLCGRTIRDSFKLAKESVEFVSSSAKRDFEKFKLLPKKGNHDVVLFKAQSLRKGELVNKTTKIPPNNLPTTIQPFVGRSIEMKNIMHSFMAKKNENCRILNIYGDKGVGKSAIAIMVSRYLNDRKIYFKNGIYYIDAMKLIQNEEALTLTEMMNVVISQAFKNAKFAEMKWYGFSNNGDTTELISNLKLFCRYGLFIIDDVDKVIAHYKSNDIDVNKEFYAVVFKMLTEVSEKIKVILISNSLLSDIYKYNTNASLSPKSYRLKQLTSTDCSTLFSKLTAGVWRANDIKENIDVMTILKNNPLQIHTLAKLKHQWECKTLTKLVETYNFKNKLERKRMNGVGGASNPIYAQKERKENREQLIRTFIKNPAAQHVWRRAHGMKICPYHKIFDILKLDFSEFTFSKRKLEPSNLMDCFRTNGMSQDLSIQIEKFDQIYSWFQGLTRLVQALSDYYNKTNPVVIHGFVSRDDAQKMLLDKHWNPPIGTFIIRFRYKQPKSIAISYKKDHSNVANIKCDLSNNNEYTFICGKKVMTLPHFISTFTPLQYLYNTQQALLPKQQVFNLHINNNNNAQSNPSWSNANSWNPPTKQPKHYNNQQPTMMHAPTANPYNHQHSPSPYNHRSHYSPQPQNSGYH